VSSSLYAVPVPRACGLGVFGRDYRCQQENRTRGHPTRSLKKPAHSDARSERSRAPRPRPAGVWNPALHHRRSRHRGHLSPPGRLSVSARRRARLHPPWQGHDRTSCSTRWVDVLACANVAGRPHAWAVATTEDPAVGKILTSLVLPIRCRPAAAGQICSTGAEPGRRIS